jgi:hypothetical protein
MDKDARLMYENYVDGITKKKSELSGNIMDIVKHGIPSKEQFIAIRAELHRFTKEIQDRGTGATEQEKEKAHHLMGQIRAYRSQHPDDPGPYAEDAENEPHGYPQGITAIQNVLINQLKKHGFELTKISHADKERDAYPTVFMHQKNGPMHRVAEIEGMGMINGEPYKEYLGKLKRSAGDDRRPDEDDPYYDTWQSIRQDHAGEEAEELPRKNKNNTLKDSFDMHVNQLKNTSTEQLIEDLKDLYRIVADEERVGDYSYDSASLDIKIIHDILKSRGLDYQKDLAPIWNKIDDEVNGNEENAEDMSKSPFHYDAMHGLAQAAHQIKELLQGAANDEARTDHIEKMAEIILGPQSEYASVTEYRRILGGMIELLNHYVVVPMN